ncbi:MULTISPECIES: LytTR family DNA-binding domain-containing protein [Ruminococcus]|uniref:Stage 0 sporulation protein A homolog n=1 Tax=Ruminococcus flavefaciens TaxID=1265 RepID=A0A315XWP2_RUMFL|nr:MULTISPECIES: LytTR family DNA-binding domain-containing protein [Ruminococcus]MBR1431047.1 response regulator transcription factor [Ruminococcus sp.]PWJ11795.1 LytTR family two component transcriptional regulator [Ruminococcus flavefaciens]SSA49982.1 two component transcriptional regulator, LytTR family [Ruminococcus flavefaciens]
MRIAICDDKMILHEELKKYLDQYSVNRNVIINCDDYTNGFDLLKSNIEYDIIFMDYQMEGIDGLETSRQIRKNKIDTTIIFLTSYPNIVFDTFEVNAYRFLVKPINYEKLSAALDDFLAAHDDSNFILIKSDEVNRRINIDDIVYIEADNKYCYIRTTDDNINYKRTLSEIEKLVPDDRFFRSHRTYLVGFRHIVSHTSTDILFDNKERALISKLKLTPFKKAFTDYIKRYNFEKW